MKALSAFWRVGVPGCWGSGVWGIVFGVMVLGVMPVQGQGVLSLEEALVEARSNNAGMVQLQHDLSYARWNTQSIKADNKPTLAFTSMYNRLGEPSTVPVEFSDELQFIELGGSNSFRTRFEFSQKLWDSGQTDHRIKAARFSEQVQRSALDIEANQLRVKVKLAYYDILHQQRLDSLYAIIVDQTKQLESISKSRFDAELILEPALLQARAEVQLAAARRAEVQGNIEKGKMHLAHLTGRQDTRFTLTGDLPDYTTLTFSADAPQTLLNQALAHRPEFDQLKFRASQQIELMQALKTPYRPRLGLQGDFTYYGPKSLFGKYSSFGGQGLNSYNWRVGLAFEMILFDGRRTRSQIEQATIRLNQVEMQSEQMEQRIRTELESLLSDLRRLQQVYEGSEMLCEAVHANLQLGRVQFENGALSALDLVQLQIAEVNSAIASAMQAFDITRLVLSLEAIVGEAPASHAILISGSPYRR